MPQDSIAGDVPASSAGATSGRPPRLAALTPNLRRFFGVALASTLGYFAFNSFLSPYLRESGVAVVFVGLFFSLAAAVEAPMAFAGGVLADRLGRRSVLVAGRLLRTAGWLVALLAPTTAGLVIAAILLGLGGVAGAGYRALIAESAVPGRRASAFAAVGFVENLVGVVVPPLVGLAAARLGLRWVLAAAATLSGLGVLALATRVRETLPPKVAGASAATPAAETRPSASESLRFIFGPDGRAAALMAVIWLFTGFAMSLLPPIWGLYVTDRFGVGYAGLGAASTAMALGAALGQLVGGQVADRIGHSRLMVISLAITVPSWVLITQANDPWLFSLLNLLTYLAAFVSAPCWEAVGANAVPRRVRGAVSGIYGAMQAIGALAGAAVTGVAYTRGITLPFWILAGTDLIMLVLVLAGRRAGWKGFGG